MISDFLSLISPGWVVMFLDSDHTVFTFRSCLALLFGILAFWISILEIFKSHQNYWHRVTDISPASKNIWNVVKVGDCHCWWTRESPWVHAAKFYGRLRPSRSILRASKFPVLKLNEIVILRVYYAIPVGFSLFRHFLDITFKLLRKRKRNHFVWLRITDEGSLPEMRIWSILLIKFDLKWCIHLSRIFFKLKQQ